MVDNITVPLYTISNNHNNMSKKFDFKQPYQISEEFEDYVKETEVDVKTRMNGRSHNSFLVGVASFLTVCLVLLGGFTWWQVFQNQKPQAAQAVLGEKESDIQNIYSGEGFSILSKKAAPKGFELTKNLGDTPYFPGKKVVTTSLKNTQTYQNQTVIDGISVTVSENDGKLDAITFAQSVASSLGSSYKVGKSDTKIPKDIILTQIDSSKDVKKQLYTAVTNDNYYVISIQQDSKNTPSLSEYSKFSDSFFENLFLN
jgi:hypothetical protein